MDAPALAAAIGGPVVGLAGVLFGWFNAGGERAQARQLARDQREHERTLARDARLNAELREAYEELLRMVFLVEDLVTRTNPIIGPAAPPPPMPPEADVRRVMARVSVIGSEEVFEALERVWAAHRTFWGHSRSVDAARQPGGGEGGGEPWREMQEAREDFLARVRELERLIRSEVRA